MAGGTITRCGNCGRLLIYGQTCMCVERPKSRCDCIHNGNEERAGPICRQRERDQWSAAMRRVPEIIRDLKAARTDLTATTTEEHADDHK